MQDLITTTEGNKMQNLIDNNVLTMTSNEIATLTGKRHDHVMRDIRDMLEQLKKDAPSFGGIFSDAYGREQPMFVLPKDMTLTLVSGYNVAMRYAIVKRWQELEASRPPQSFAHALRLAADQQEEIERQAARLAYAEPMAAVAEQIVAEELMVGLRDMAGHLDVSQNFLIAKLYSLGWCYRDQGDGSTKPYAFIKDNGLMVVKKQFINGMYRERTLFTSKGAIAFGKVMNQCKI